MSVILRLLFHVQTPEPTESPNLAVHNGKRIGTYTSEARAMQGPHRVADREGFRDWPDGFRLFTMPVDRDYFSQGFVPGPHGIDVAVAADGSGIVGNDSGFAEWSGDGTRDLAAEEARLNGVCLAEQSAWIWSVTHYKMAETDDCTFEDMGMKLVGLYSNRAAAERAIERLRAKPGFRDWPGGFRLHGGRPDIDDWLEGFAEA